MNPYAMPFVPSAGAMPSELPCSSIGHEPVCYAIKHRYHFSEMQTCVCKEVEWLCMLWGEAYPRCFECAKAVRSTQTLVGMAHGGGRPGLRWAWFVFRVIFEAV